MQENNSDALKDFKVIGEDLNDVKVKEEDQKNAKKVKEYDPKKLENKNIEVEKKIKVRTIMAMVPDKLAGWFVKKGCTKGLEFNSVIECIYNVE